MPLIERGAPVEAEERARADAAAADNGAERALKAMMGGRLAARDAAAAVWTLEKPEWMLEGEGSWSEEQKGLAAAWAAEQARLDGERATQRAALEAEVRAVVCLVRA